MKNFFKNTFPLDKKYLSLAGASKKNLLVKKSVSMRRNRVSFKKVTTPEF